MQLYSNHFLSWSFKLKNWNLSACLLWKWGPLQDWTSLIPSSEITLHWTWVEGHLNPGLFNPRPFNTRVFNHELFNPRLFNHDFLNHGVEKFMVEKSGVWGWSLGLKSPGLRCPSTVEVWPGIPLTRNLLQLFSGLRLFPHWLTTWQWNQYREVASHDT